MANEIIRPSKLPPRSNPVASEVVPSDNGASVGGVSWKDGVNAGRPMASRLEAEAGVVADKAMSPLTTKQAIDAQVEGIVDEAIPIRDDKAVAASTPVADGTDKIIVLGEDGGTFVSSGTGAPDFVTPAGDGAAEKSWWRETDINLKRLNPDVKRALTAPAFERAYMKRVALVIPYRNPEYDAVMSAFGRSLYPQAFVIDDVASQIFIISAGDATNPTVVQVYDYALVDGSIGNVEYNRAFQLFDARVVTEGGFILYIGGQRRLHVRTDGNDMSYYDITTMPNNLSSISKTFTLPIYTDRIFCFYNGTLTAAERAIVSGSGVRSRSIFSRYDADFNRVGWVDFGETYMGYVEGVAQEASIPKAQGMAQVGDTYIASMGGFWDAGSSPYGYQGIVGFTTAGNPTFSALVRPEAMKRELEGLGLHPILIENEGIQTTRDGKVYSLTTTASSSVDPAIASVEGIVIWEEFATGPDVIDFTLDAAPSHAFDTRSVQVGYYPRTIDSSSGNFRLILPSTGEVLDTWNKICDAMIANRWGVFRYYTSNNQEIRDFNNVVHPNGYTVEFMNPNNGTFRVKVFQNDATQYSYQITGSSGSRVQSANPGAIRNGSLNNATATAGSNVDTLSAGRISWQRVGNTVTFSGVLVVSHLSSDTETVVQITPPEPSNFGFPQDVTGTVASSSGDMGLLMADEGKIVCRYRSMNTFSRMVGYSGSYVVRG